MRVLRFVLGIITSPFRFLWHVLDPQTQSGWGIAFSSLIERHAGFRVTLLPAAVFIALLLLVLVALPTADAFWEPGRPIIALLLGLLLLNVIGVYIGYVIRGEGGPPGQASIRRGTRAGSGRPSPLDRFLDRFRSPTLRLARRGDVDGLMGLAVNGTAKERADAINRLWGKSHTLDERQRDQFRAVSRRAAQDADDGVRGQALFALGELRHAEDHDLLEASLRDPVWFPRLAAAFALSWAKPPANVRSIGRLLNDEEPMVREQVRDLLRSIAQHETDPTARQDAITALDDAGLPLT
jgi:hypothetical protein